MAHNTENQHPSQASNFARQAEGAQRGPLAEVFDLLRHNKKWWLTPIILSLLVFGALAILSGTVAAPFIYTLF